MRNTYTHRIKSFFKMFAGFIIAVPLLIAGSVYAATMYSTGAMLQPGDVTSSHIRDNTIVNADIYSNAAILISKLTAGAVNGNLIYSNNNTLATSTALSFATSTNKLTITGALAVTASTTLNGVEYKWPSADGTSGQFISTAGTGVMSWVSGATSRFGGTGADGALVGTSTNTVINLGAASIVTKNYTSISLTGTSSLTFTNAATTGTIVFLRSQGACTITTSSSTAIDLRGVGASGGLGGSGTGTNVGNGGNGGASASTNGVGSGWAGTGTGANGAVGLAFGYLPTGSILQTGGPGGITTAGSTGVGISPAINSSFAKYIKLLLEPGSGGGGGSVGSGGSGGNGGAGGGALYMECNGAYNATGTINASGTNGSNTAVNSGGGGGGGGGSIIILYNSLTGNTGTYTVAGGAGGTTISGGTGGAGGAGFSVVTANEEFN